MYGRENLGSEFYINLKKENGQEYEPGTFDGIRASIERHLKNHEYSRSLRDKEFNLSTRALSAKKVQLKTLGKGHKPNASKAVSKDEEHLLWGQGQLGDSTPRILIFSLCGTILPNALDYVVAMNTGNYN